MPCCASRVASVAPIMEKAKPDDTPRNSAASGAASKYGLRPGASRARQSTSERVVIVDRERRVIGEAPALVDRLSHRRRGDAGRGDLVIDAPADVFRPRPAAVRPPGVLVGLVVQPPEDVDEADLVEHAREPGALLRQEARVLLVRAPVAQIDLLVRDVPVAAEDDFGVALAQPLEMQKELLEEAELRCLPMGPGRPRGQINGDYPESAEARLDVAPFGVELAAGEA